MKNKLTNIIGKRILSEANDLKRTVGALANDIGMDENSLQKIVNGECCIEDSYDVIKKMGSEYPIDISDLYLYNNDCENGIKIMVPPFINPEDKILLDTRIGPVPGL